MTLFHKQLGSYHGPGLRDTLEAGYQALGGDKVLFDRRQTCLLKPNLVAPRAKETNVCTRPEVILAVVDSLLDRGIQVSIGESPGFGNTAATLDLLGLTDDLKKRKVPCFTFEKVRFFSTTNPKFRDLSIAAELADYDGLLNLAKVKTHCQTQFSGAVKNLYGCVPGKRKAVRHFKTGRDELSFMQMLIDNYHEAGAFLHIADGIEGLHRHGPTSGETIQLGSFFVGDDGVELDWAVCKKIQLDPMSTLQYQVLGEQKEALILGDPILEQSHFVHAPKLAISFNPLRILISVLKQGWLQWKGKA